MLLFFKTQLQIVVPKPLVLHTVYNFFWKSLKITSVALNDGDFFSNAAELPISHLLHHVIPRSYTFPVDPSAQSATDETAVQLSELLSLPVLMKRSVTAPLVSQ